jgi:hypothetical protein
MTTRDTMRRAAVIAMALALFWSCAGNARAAVLHGTFTGVMNGGGIDFFNTFGLGTGDVFAGQTITGHLYLDLAAAPGVTFVGSLADIYENYTGAPWLWGSFTLNGVTRAVGPEQRTYTGVNSADFGAAGDYLTFSTNADVIELQPDERLVMRSSLDLAVLDWDDIVVPGKGLPTEGFTWTPDHASDSGTGQFLVFDQLETLPNGPLTNLAFAQGFFTLTEVTFQVVDSPASLPLSPAGIAALVLLHTMRRRPASDPRQESANARA